MRTCRWILSSFTNIKPSTHSEHPQSSPLMSCSAVVSTSPRCVGRSILPRASQDRPIVGVPGPPNPSVRPAAATPLIPLPPSRLPSCPPLMMPFATPLYPSVPRHGLSPPPAPLRTGVASQDPAQLGGSRCLARATAVSLPLATAPVDHIASNCCVAASRIRMPPLPPL